ncbi:MAG TPA: glycolate oxidase subunit GlcF [Casimicrobiaceae bacterium]|nr:glycolate oxidase subunit GlcF [Casimicrobiaceae bacterium]
METRLADFIRDTPEGREADAILRACVHCGFCTATCPTYQLLGDELDGPRGRIYLIKQTLEGGTVSASTQLHLDRCLSCRSCETTCPSGVRYGRLADIGRHVVETRVGRRRGARILRWVLGKGLSQRGLFAAGLATGRLLRPLLPRVLAAKVPATSPAKRWPAARHSRKMLALEGCVQGSIAPSIDAALARVLDRIDISFVRVGGGCCGAVVEHLGAHEGAQRLARRNIDAWWPHIERGAEAIVVTASGCGVLVKDYAWLMRDDPAYADKARRVAELARDPVEVIAAEWKRFAPLVAMDHGPLKVAFQSPCTLQHGQKLAGRVEEILQAIGLELTDVAGAYLCCGSAGTYSILQPALSERLKADKIAALEAGDPEIIATANIGCLAHLQSASARPVRHWVELFDARLRSRVTPGQATR